MSSIPEQVVWTDSPGHQRPAAPPAYSYRRPRVAHVRHQNSPGHAGGQSWCANVSREEQNSMHVIAFYKVN